MNADQVDNPATAADVVASAMTAELLRTRLQEHLRDPAVWDQLAVVDATGMISTRALGTRDLRDRMITSTRRQLGDLLMKQRRTAVSITDSWWLESHTTNRSGPYTWSYVSTSVALGEDVWGVGYRLEALTIPVMPWPWPAADGS